jgi:hypothetical protein
LPSTTSDVAIASVKSKPGTALLDVRAAAWNRILKNDLLDENAPGLPEQHKNPQIISTLAVTAIDQGVTSGAHAKLEKPATIGPWESASQVALGTYIPRNRDPCIPGTLHMAANQGIPIP